MPEDLAVTVTLTLLEVLLPGSGFLTLTANMPAVEIEPLAVSWVAETYLVVIAELPSSTCAEGKKLLPIIVSE